MTEVEDTEGMNGDKIVKKVDLVKAKVTEIFMKSGVEKSIRRHIDPKMKVMQNEETTENTGRVQIVIDSWNGVLTETIEREVPMIAEKIRGMIENMEKEVWIVMIGLGRGTMIEIITRGTQMVMVIVETKEMNQFPEKEEQTMIGEMKTGEKRGNIEGETRVVVVIVMEGIELRKGDKVNFVLYWS